MQNKNHYSSGKVVVGLIIVVGALAVSAVRAQRSPMAEILYRMDNHNRNLTSLRSNVTMDKTDSTVQATDRYEGTTSYLPESFAGKMFVRIDWSKPAVENMVVIGPQYKLYRPKLKQVIQGTTSGAKNAGAAGGALAFIGMSREKLKELYDVVFIAKEAVGGVSAFHLQLTPKTKTSYKIAELWVDNDGMPILAKVTEKNNDITTVLLTNIQKNVKIPESFFTLDLPKDVTIVKG